jgi:hypothetical protein
MTSSIQHARTGPHAASKRQAASNTPGQRLRLCFTGDVCLGKGVFDAHAQRPLESMLEGLRNALDGHDLVVGNLEFAVAPSAGWRAPRRGAMVVEASLLKGLGRTGFHAFSLANNHVMDAGRAGLDATLRLLASEGLAWVGAGRNRGEALHGLVQEVCGRRVGLLSACDWSLHFARGHAAGIAPLDAAALERRVRALRQQCDVVAVLLHADLEFTAHPAPWRMRIARRLVECGAHAVIQHHPHVIQGWERRDAGLIAYSLGNCVFRIDGNEYQDRHPGTAEGLLLSLEVDFPAREAQPRLTPRFIPLRIGNDHLPRVAHAADAERILGTLARLSAELCEPERVRAAWRRRAGAELRRVAYGMYVDAMRGRASRALRAPFQVLAHPEDRRWLWGCLTAGYL